MIKAVPGLVGWLYLDAWSIQDFSTLVATHRRFLHCGCITPGGSLFNPVALRSQAALWLHYHISLPYHWASNTTMAIRHAVITLLWLFLLQSALGANKFNLTQCALDAADAFTRNPNASFLVQADGSYTTNLSNAWGIRYKTCNNICGPRGGWEEFDWAKFSQRFTTWLLPWLALCAQLSFETVDRTTNLMALCLAVGSPMLVTYSLCITVLNTRWINRTFRQLKEENIAAGGEHVEAIVAARFCLVESQHVPIKVYQGSQREIAHLVVLPENRTWWKNLASELRKTKRKWTYSLVAQVLFVVVSQTFTIIDFFNPSSSSSYIGMGLATNCLWIWMIPVVLGWVWIGTQTSALAFKSALSQAGGARILGKEVPRGCAVGFRDRTHFESVEWEWLEKARLPSASHLSISPCDRAASASGTGLSQLPSGDTAIIDLERALSHGAQAAEKTMQRTFLGLNMAGCDSEAGSIFNFARTWTHRNSVAHIAAAYHQLNLQLSRHSTLGHSENLDPKIAQYNGTDLSRFISSLYHDFDVDSLPTHSSVLPSSAVWHCITASLVAMLLQWGTTGSAILIAYR
jgi:hypothetical protein